MSYALECSPGPRSDARIGSTFSTCPLSRCAALIVDHARRRNGLKRGGGQAHVSLDEARDHTIVLDGRIAEINDALTRLEQLDPRPATLLSRKSRFFGGLTEQEIADVLRRISLATVKRDWDFARSWLLTQISVS